jgi:hypothetical protein
MRILNEETQLPYWQGISKSSQISGCSGWGTSGRGSRVKNRVLPVGRKCHPAPGPVTPPISGPSFPKRRPLKLSASDLIITREFNRVSVSATYTHSLFCLVPFVPNSSRHLPIGLSSDFPRQRHLNPVHSCRIRRYSSTFSNAGSIGGVSLPLLESSPPWISQRSLTAATQCDEAH